LLFADLLDCFEVGESIAWGRFHTLVDIVRRCILTADSDGGRHGECDQAEGQQAQEEKAAAREHGAG